MYYDHFFKAKITGPGQFIVNKLNHKLAKKVLGLFRKDKIKLLEIGHGRGGFADTLMAAGGRERVLYHGIEPNKPLCDLGVGKGYNLINGKVPPFPADKAWRDFDCVYLSHVLEHFPDYDAVVEVLSEIRKTLVPGGLFVLLFPDYLDYKEDYYNVDYSHGYIITERRMKNLFLDCGFQVTESASFRGFFSSPWHLLLSPAHFAIRFLSGMLYNLTGAEKFFKIKITFSKNILMIARKPEKD